MPKMRCPKCKAPMRVVSSKNADYGTWDKDSKPKGLGYRRWNKVKQRSRYEVIMKCPSGACRTLMTYSSSSKSRVHKRLNWAWEKARHELITKDAEKRKMQEALEQKRKEQDEEKEATLRG